MIIGDGDNNTLEGNDGIDRLIGGAGDDTLNGGGDFFDGINNPFDTVDYGAEGGGFGVTVDLGAGTATDSHVCEDVCAGLRIRSTSYRLGH